MRAPKLYEYEKHKFEKQLGGSGGAVRPPARPCQTPCGENFVLLFDMQKHNGLKEHSKNTLDSLTRCSESTHSSRLNIIPHGVESHAQLSS